MYILCSESHETNKTVGEIVDEWQSADGSKFVSFVSFSSVPSALPQPHRSHLHSKGYPRHGRHACAAHRARERVLWVPESVTS